MQTIIVPFTQIWWIGLILSFLSIFCFIYFFRFSTFKLKDNLLKITSIFLLISWLYGHYDAYAKEIWSLKENLPLHLCRISIILALIMSWFPKQWIYEWLLFLSIPSGFHSILTPELTQGYSPYLVFDFYFVHASLIFIPLFLTINKGMRPRKNGWIRAFLYLQIPFLIIFPLNFLLDSNYMFLAEKPTANNPFLIGEWPFYIIGLEFIILFHLILINLPFYLKKNFSS